MLDGQRILVVEDEPVIALSLEDLLIDGGARPVFAATLEQAEAIVASEPIDAAILDVNIHGRQSYPLALNFRARNLPFVFATGYGALAHPEAFAGAPTVAKPYSLAEIERALDEARTGATR